MSHMATSVSPTSASSLIAQLINDEAVAVPICTPVYADAPGGFKKALGDGSAKAKVVGLVIDQSIPSTKSGAVLSTGVVTASTAQWDVVAGTSGGLTYGTLYYLSTSVAGTLTTVATSAVPVVFGLAPTVGAIVIGSGGTGSGGITNTAGNNVVMKSNGTNAVASGMADDGTVVALSSRKLQVGSQAVNIGQQVYITKAQSSTTTQVWIEQNDTGHQGDTTGLLGGCEAINLVLRNHTAFDTSASAAPANASCIDLTVDATRTTGAQPLTNTGILIQSANGDTNYAINILSGILKSVASVDFSGAVTLGNNVGNFEIPGSTSTVARIGIGALPGVDGTQIQTKNTVPGSALAGIEVGLDTTINAGIRGGYLLKRGAGGNYAGNDGGLVVAGGSGYPFTTSAANEVSLYSEFATPLCFGADSTGFTKGMTLETTNQLRVAGSIQTGSLNLGGGARWSSGAGTPNGTVTGWPGDLYSNTSGGAGATLWVKESGSNTNTGWTAK